MSRCTFFQPIKVNHFVQTLRDSEWTSRDGHLDEFMGLLLGRSYRQPSPTHPRKNREHALHSWITWVERHGPNIAIARGWDL